MSEFHDLIANEKLFNKKTVFHKKCPKRLKISFKNRSDVTKTAKQHKTKKWSKTLKNAKSTENRFEVILISNKVNIFKRKSFFTKKVLKRLKSLKTCSK